jgi:serine/threonine protein kinase
MKPIRLINKGSYGCIYYPGIKCNSQEPESKEYVTKIQPQSEDVGSANEMKISKEIVAKIPNYERFFAPITDSCNINIAIADPATILHYKKCDPVIDAVKQGKTQLLSNKVRYLGKTTLGKYVDVNAKKAALSKSKTPPKLISHLCKYFFYLAESIEKLVEIRIIHNDIKDNNIMIQPKTKYPIIIDFGQGLQIPEDATKMNNTPAFFTTFGYQEILSHPYYSVDLALISYIFQKGRTIPQKQADFTEFYQSFEKAWTPSQERSSLTNMMSSLASPEKIAQFKKEITAYIKTLESKTWEAVYGEILAYYPTWDIYSIYCMYLFFQYENAEAISTIKPHIAKWNAIIAIFESQIYCSPNARIPIKEVVSKVKEVIKPPTPTTALPLPPL